MKKPPLTRAVLDASGCGQLACAHDHSELYLHSVCHTGAGCHVKYVKATGVLEVMCRVCGAPIGAIQVAP